MRVLLFLVVILAAAIGAGWWFGEPWLAEKARSTLSQETPLSFAPETKVTLADAAELRAPPRFGLTLQDARLNSPDRGVQAAALTLSAPLWSPTRLDLAVTEPVTLTTPNAPDRTLAIENGQLGVDFAVSRWLALSEVALSGDALMLDAQAVAGPVTVMAKLSHAGLNPPAETGATYHLDLSAQDVTAAGWAPLFGIEATDAHSDAPTLSLQGDGRIWLDDVPKRNGLFSLTALPRVLGLAANGLDLTMGAASARIAGRLTGDAEGRATGMLVLDTADPDALMRAAIGAGLLPAAQAPEITAALAALGKAQAQNAEGAAETLRAGGVSSARIEPALPTQAPGTTRLTLSLDQGKVMLGPLVLGEAPTLFKH